MAEGTAQGQTIQSGFEHRAERALEVGVHDDQRRPLGATHVVIETDGSKRRAAQRFDQPAASASKIRLAPGRSLGEAAW